MFGALLPPLTRKSQALQMLGDSTDATYDPVVGAQRSVDLFLLLRATVKNEVIPPGESRKVLCLLLSGLLSGTQPRWIPLKMAPLTIELEINPLFRQYLNTADANASSRDWSLEDDQIKVDLCEVDAFLSDR